MFRRNENSAFFIWFSMYRIYALIDPTNEEIRYYGKTQLGTVECRLKQHLVDLRSRGHLHVYRWISKILNLGLMLTAKSLSYFLCKATCSGAICSGCSNKSNSYKKT